MKTEIVNGKEVIPNVFGVFPNVSGIEKIFEYAGVYWSEETRDWVYLSEEINCIKNTEGGGIKDQSVRIPIRAYNFEYALWEVMQEDRMGSITINTLREAVKKGYANKYLPSMKGFNSYSQLLSSISNN